MLLESLACGTPVGTPEVVRDAVVGRDAGSVAWTIRSLFGQYPDGDGGRRYAEGCWAEASSSNVQVALFREVIGQRRG